MRMVILSDTQAARKTQDSTQISQQWTPWLGRRAQRYRGQRAYL